MKRTFPFLFLLIFISLTAGAAHALVQVEFLYSIPAGKPITVAIDSEGKLYASQKEDTVWVLESDGQLVTKLGDSQKDKEGKPALKKPRGVSFFEDKIYVVDQSLDRIVLFKKDGSYLDYIGRGGGNPKEFDSPRGIFIHGGIIYVADTDNDRIQILGSNGVFLDNISKGAPADPLKEPIALAIGNDGTIFVADAKAGTVRLFKNNVQTSRMPRVEEIAGMAIDHEGVFIADAANCKIHKFDFQGKELFSFGSKGKDPAQFQQITGLALGADGKVYVSDIEKGAISVFQPEQGIKKPSTVRSVIPNSVQWLSVITNVIGHKIIWGRDGKAYLINRDNETISVIKDNAVEKTFKIPKCEPVSIAQDMGGGLWVLDSDNESVILVDTEGNILRKFGSGGSKEGYLSNPADIVVSNKGVIFVADRGNKRVQAFNSSGLFLQAIGTDKGKELIQSPISLALDPLDFLYVLDSEERKVAVFAPSGAMVTKFGGEGVFEKPVGIAVTGSEIFVLDKAVPEIKVFTKDGKFSRKFIARGNREGDLYEPTSLAVRDEIELIVTDTGNKRIETFGLVYTPKPPRKVNAVAGMRAIKLTWEKSQDPFVDEYRIYRSHRGQSQWLASVNRFEFEDTGLTPATEYEYSVSAVAKRGNEGPASPPVVVAPSKYIPVPPTGISATTDEWSVEIKWQPNKESFIKEYAVYRDIDGATRKLAATQSPSFSETALDQETSYTYHIAAVSTDDMESPKYELKIKTMAATKPPLEIEVVKISDVFSNSYKMYENEGIGNVRLINNTRESVQQLKLGFTIQNYMDFPSEVMVEKLPPGRSEIIPIRAVFNNNILQVTEDTPVQAEFRVTYYRSQKPNQMTKSHTIMVYDKHRMMWDTRERFAAFITPKDAIVMDFARSIVTKYTEADNPIVIAGVVFDAMGILGVTYVKDPSNPYQIVSGKTDVVDFVQYPQETLRRNAGDCDDLVGLYSAALESVGIRTMVLEVPGHMLMMLDTRIETDDTTDTMDGMFIKHLGTLWMPVEATMMGNSFLKAWEAGSRTTHEWEGKGLGIMDIRAAWERFKPATLPHSDFKPKIVERAQIDAKFRDEAKTLRKIWIKFTGSQYVEVLRKDPNNVHALLQLGIVYAKAGEFDESFNLFTKALTLSPEDSSLHNSLGNVHYLKGQDADAERAYLKASELDPNDPLLLVNLARAYQSMGKKDRAVEVFNQAIALDPSVKLQYRSMAIELSGAF
jgi:DNA-binding beta-propeller fold protein YncE